MHRWTWTWAVMLSACGWHASDDEGLVRLQQTVRSGADGTVVLDIPVGAESAMMVWAQPETGQVVLDRLVAPDGSMVVDGPALRDRPFLLTGAVFWASSSTLVWPVRGVDRALEPGPWEVVFDVGGEKGIRMDVVVHLREESNVSVVPIYLAVDVSLMADPAFVTVLDSALVRWDEIYAEMGLVIDVLIAPSELGSPTPPGEGDGGLWSELAAESPDRIVVGVVEQLSVEGVAGTAGGIPGPREASAISAVAVASVYAAGPDGSFNLEERRIFGETMAHEVLHYLGVFHPVEADWSTFDSLADTPVCVDSDQCTTALGTNLMFPFPVCNSVTCLPQGRVTANQGAVAAHWVGVRP